MRDTLNGRWIVLTAAGTVWPGVAAAAETASTVLSVAPVAALTAALAVAVCGCIVFRRRAAASEATAERLTGETALRDALSALCSEQAIVWPFNGDDERITSGLAPLLGVEAITSDGYDIFKTIFDSLLG